MPTLNAEIEIEGHKNQLDEIFDSDDMVIRLMERNLMLRGISRLKETSRRDHVEMEKQFQ